MIDKDYLQTIRERGVKSHVYKKYQSTGLALAQLLDDQKHIALYIRLAKKGNDEELIRLAKTVAERKLVQNKGAYFMKLLKEKNFFVTPHDISES